MFETADNKATAIRFFEAMNAGDVDDALRLMTRPISYKMIGIGEVGDKISGIMAAMRPHVDGAFCLKILDIIGEGDKVAVELKGDAVLKNGDIYDNQYHLKLFFKDGKIERIHEYFDTLHGSMIWGKILGPVLEE